MTGITVRAASYLDAAGCGNGTDGRRSWPPAVAAAIQRGELPDQTWAALFRSSCPRFGRMDRLSRLASIAAELLATDFAALPDAERASLGVGLETCSGCLAADRQFLATLSPSVFTYTLPSTAIGEICIRYRLQGPGLCLLTADATGETLLTEADRWLRTGTASACLALGCEPEDTVAYAAYLGAPGDGAGLGAGVSLAALCRELVAGRPGGG